MPVNDMQERITLSFESQGLMKTLGASLVLVANGEVHISSTYKVVALMQATMANVLNETRQSRAETSD